MGIEEHFFLAGRTLIRNEVFESSPPASSSSSLTDSTGNILINFLTQLFSANSVKKEPNINILYVDMLSLTVFFFCNNFLKKSRTFLLFILSKWLNWVHFKLENSIWFQK